ncbi:MAG: hypothetical protein EA416_05880 [Trueperaceae bacterium]|nr:MAG: hypothetical protein EA416_05880 [Trueperaceae bacterium]
MRRLRGEVEMRIVITAALVALLGIALAVTLPPDATMFVTDDDGVIVGVGRSHAGETFVLDVIASYQGFARLVIVTSGGTVEVHDVMVTGGTVLLEFVDLRAIARRSGFVEVFVEAIDVFDAAYQHLPAAVPGSEPDAAPPVDHPGSAGAPSQPADAGHAEQGPDDGPGAAPAPVSPVPAPPVVGPADPPAGSPDTPAGPPVAPGPPGEQGPPASAPGLPDGPPAPGPPGEQGPPASTPGLPDGPPAHGPGGAHGGGPDGADGPTSDDEDADEDPDDDQPGPPGLDRRP